MRLEAILSALKRKEFDFCRAFDKDPDPGSTAGYTFFTLSQGIGSSLEESRTIKALSRTLDPGAD